MYSALSMYSAMSMYTVHAGARPPTRLPPGDSIERIRMCVRYLYGRRPIPAMNCERERVHVSYYIKRDTTRRLVCGEYSYRRALRKLGAGGVRTVS